MRHRLCLATIVAACLATGPARAQSADPDLTGYRTTSTAIAAASPAAPEAPRLAAYLGVTARADRRKVMIEGIAPGSPAETAGLAAGDQVVRFGRDRVSTVDELGARIAQCSPDDVVSIEVRRERKPVVVSATLRALSRPMSLRAARSGDSGPIPDQPPAPTTQVAAGPARVFRKPVYRLAVVCVEYPDVKHNSAIEPSHWEEALFSTGVYRDKQSVTGQPVYGSVNDYYRDVSCGALAVEGKAIPWITMSQDRSQYGQSAGPRAKTSFLTEALDLLTARDGAQTLEGFDGLLFIYAGERVRTTRGSLYWPHRSSVTHKGKRWPYFIVPEGGPRMTNISVIVHEFGHMLGLPDLYARPENPGSEGVGVWCAMSQQLANGRPQQMSAWCKERMGWLKPVVIDPTVRQKLILSPIEGSATECFKVLLRPDGSEYLLLENRRKQGFDSGLPGEGLLIWRVVGSKPILEESHGIEGPAGPQSNPASVPYPSAANDSYTPDTTPNSRPLLGAGLAARISAIRRLADGRVCFQVGYEYR